MEHSSSKVGIIDHGAEGSYSTSVTSSAAPTVSLKALKRGSSGLKRSRAPGSIDASAITLTGTTAADTAATATTATATATGTNTLKPVRALARSSSSSDRQGCPSMSAVPTANIEMLDRVTAAAADSTSVSSVVVKKSMRRSSAPSTSATATPATAAATATTAGAEGVAMRNHSSTMNGRRISSDATSTISSAAPSGLHNGGTKAGLKARGSGQYSSISRQYTSSNAGDDTATVAATARSGSSGSARRAAPTDMPQYAKDIRLREDSNGTTTTDTNSSGSGAFANSGDSHAYSNGDSRSSEQRRSGIAGRRSGSVNGSVSGSVSDTNYTYTRHNGASATGSSTSQTVDSNSATAATVATADTADTSSSIAGRLGPKPKKGTRVSSANSKSEKISSKSGNAALTYDATPAPPVTTAFTTTTGVSNAASVTGRTNSVKGSRGNSSSVTATRGTATAAAAAAAAAAAGSGNGSETVKGVRGRGAAHAQFHIKGNQQAVVADDNQLYFASLPDQSATAPSAHSQASVPKRQQPRYVPKSGDEIEAIRENRKNEKAMSGVVMPGECGKGFGKHYNHEVEVRGVHISIICASTIKQLVTMLQQCFSLFIVQYNSSIAMFKMCDTLCGISTSSQLKRRVHL
jgi:hypothetical protein